MKKLNKYYINDGVDGVVVAKSLKQAINLYIHIIMIHILKEKF